jgi:elongation factor G
MPLETISESKKIRNIGIIAHIDAGKTTLTERMLYYSGVLDEPGEVHHGNTTMDYLKEERERGITIRSACITFSWEGHHINLIDTPGHIDFNAEVERSLRVLDGAVCIFDSSKGVETQTELVWQQADNYNIPKIAFINKLDKSGADLHGTLDSIRTKLGVTPFLMQIPILTREKDGNDIFDALIDLVSMQQVSWGDELGNSVKIVDLEQSSEHYNEAV